WKKSVHGSADRSMSAGSIPLPAVPGVRASETRAARAVSVLPMRMVLPSKSGQEPYVPGAIRLAEMAASRRGSRILLFALLGLCLSGASPARPSVSPTPPPATASAAAGRFDPEAATRDWLARISPAKKARSDAYFEGGYWLHLWGFLYGIATMGLLLAGGWSARMRDLAERMSRRPAVQTYLYWVQFLLATVVLLFPLTVYVGFLPERRYGLATQTFWPWMGDRLTDLHLSLPMSGF